MSTIKKDLIQYHFVSEMLIHIVVEYQKGTGVDAQFGMLFGKFANLRLLI